MRSQSTLTIIAGIFITVSALAAVPQTVNYQGYLKDSAGTPVTSATSIRFSLYSSNPARSNPVWTESRIVTPSNGIYSIQLGTVTPISAPFGVPYWLGVKVSTDAEMPLQALSSAPYALRAQIADAVPDSSITTAKIANGAVTDSKITGPISSAKIISAGLNADTVDGLHAADFSRNTATDTGQANLLALIASLQAQIDTLNRSTSAESVPLVESTDVTRGVATDVSLNGQYNIAMDPQGNATAAWILTNVNGEPVVMANHYSVGSGWGTAVVLEGTGGSEARVAVDGFGNATVVWTKNDWTTYSIKTCRYAIGAGWGTATQIATNSVHTPQVAVNYAGDATIVYQQNDGTRENIWAIRYTAGSGWGTAALIESGSGTAMSPRVAMSGDSAIAVWSQHDGTRYSIYGNVYRSGAWGTAALIETNAINNAVEPKIAMDGQGNATVVWEDGDWDLQETPRLWFNRYSTGTGWGTAAEIPASTTLPHIPQVAMDVRGNGLIVWIDKTDGIFSLWSKRYVAGTGWSGGTLLKSLVNGSSTNNNFSPRVSMDSQGNAIVTWLESDRALIHATTIRDNLWARRYSVVNGWGSPFPAESAGGSIREHQLAMDAQGNAMAVYSSSEASNGRSSYMPATSWKSAELIETGNAGDAGVPHVAMDPKRNAIAVWEQHDGVRYRILTNRYSPLSGWGTPAAIDAEISQNARAPRVAMDAQGNAVAVWPHYDGTRYNIWANRYTAGGGWGSPVAIETGDGDARLPRVAMDAAGNALVVWQQSDGIRTNIRANRYAAGTGWGTDMLIENDDAGPATVPQVAMDALGNAIAVWVQSDGDRTNILANRYSLGVGWGTVVAIETDAGNAGAPQVAVNSLGSAVAVWEQSDGTRNNIWSNRYTAGSGWGTAGLIETDNTGTAGASQVAMDSLGNAIAVWVQSDGTRNNIWANRYTTGAGWGTAALIETDNTGPAAAPQIAMDTQGNANVVWQQYDGSVYNILANWYNPGAGWGVPVLLESAAGAGRTPQIASSSQGSSIAVWAQTDGTYYSIWANRRQ